MNNNKDDSNLKQGITVKELIAYLKQCLQNAKIIYVDNTKNACVPCDVTLSDVNCDGKAVYIGNIKNSAIEDMCQFYGKEKFQYA